jgi:hypothetical protein
MSPNLKGLEIFQPALTHPHAAKGAPWDAWVSLLERYGGGQPLPKKVSGL